LRARIIGAMQQKAVALASNLKVKSRFVLECV